MWNKAELVWTAVRLVHCVGGSSFYLQLVWDILEIEKYAYKKKAGLIQFCHSDIVHWLYVCCINKNLVCTVEDWYNQYLLMWKTALPGQHCRPGDSVAACWWAAEFMVTWWTWTILVTFRSSSRMLQNGVLCPSMLSMYLSLSLECFLST